jgi:uncharacterized protein (UPF0332 family)
MREIDDLLVKAEKFLKTAEDALHGGDYDSCVSRCYYAMFFLAEAVLLTKNLKASSHKGVLGLFGQHFVKTGVFDKELGRALNDAYDKRQIGDYGVGFSITQKEAQDMLKTALNFVDTMKSHLERASVTKK